MDSQAERIVSQVLNKVMEERTTFVTANRLSKIIDANQIFFIEEDKLIKTHQE
ncbi:hypothetical protein ACFP65_02135 [Marinilactibacillus sp. GCM10026970]|uniref:hypothetical protein n=1 Tax=Marinilactibacillus sp. GCM10026970 TaxID=3252642 RepID=UPI0036171D9F